MDEKPSHDEVLQFMSDLETGSNLFAQFDGAIRARLFAVVDKPSQQTWDEAHFIILSFNRQRSSDRQTTLWQALNRHTDYGVTSRPTPESGSKLPTSDQLLIAIRAELTATAS